jgi:NAD-dependent dihydropyrimidine dehydrogenase PreA subunit
MPQSPSTALRGEDIASARAAHEPRVAEDGHPRVELRQRITPDKRHKVPLKDKVIALANIRVEVELGFDLNSPMRRRSAASIATCRRLQRLRSASNAMLRRHLPDGLITFTENGEEAELRLGLTAPAIEPHARPLCFDSAQTGRIMAKDEDVCLHCGLCAERCPTGPGTCRNSC